MSYLGRRGASAALTSADIPDDSITAAKIVDGAVGVADIGAGAVDTAELADDAVTGAKIENNPTIAGNLTVSGDFVPSTPLSNRNMIINGGMNVAQRSTSAVNNGVQGSTIGYDTLDRWGYWAISAADFSVQQVTDSPTGFDYSLKVTSLAASTISDGYYAGIGQRIEANGVSQLCLNTSSAKTVTLSFWVKSSITGTFGVYLWKGTNWNPSYTTTYTISSADTWEEKTISITFPTSGTFATTGNNWSFEVGFTLASGATYQNSSLNSWNASAFKIGHSSLTNLLATNSATLQVTGVQLELGSSATPFEHRTYGEELARCQRYYYTHFPAGTSAGGLIGKGAFNTAGQFEASVYHHQTMRAAATLEINGGTNFFIIHFGGGSVTFDDIAIHASSNPNCTSVYKSGLSGTIGYGGNLAGNTSSLSVSFLAEL